MSGGGKVGRRALARAFGACWTAEHGIRCEVARGDRGPVNYDDKWSEAHHPASEAGVTCWCEEEVVQVPLDLVRAGLTFACERDECRALEDAALVG